MNKQANPTLFVYNDSLENLVENFSKNYSSIYEVYSKLVNYSKNQMFGFTNDLFDEFLRLRLGTFFISNNEQIIFEPQSQKNIITSIDELISELRISQGVQIYVIYSLESIKLAISENKFCQIDLRNTFGFIHMCWHLLENKKSAYEIMEKLLPYDSQLKCFADDFTHNAILALLNTIPSKEIALAWE